MLLYIYTFRDLLKVLDRALFGDLLKVLDRALSDYFVRLLDCWKFNAFIYKKCWSLVERVRQSPI